MPLLDMFEYSDEQARDESGRWTSSGASVHKSVTPADKAKLDAAMAHFDKDELKGLSVGVVDSSRIHGNSSGKNIFVSRKSLNEEHPAFVAGIIKHESIHSSQDKNLSSIQKENQARDKTRTWALRKSFSTSDRGTSDALQKVIKQSTTVRR